MSQALLLNSGEQIVRSWRGTLTKEVAVNEVEQEKMMESTNHTNGIELENMSDLSGGVLVLTNRRLVWMKRRGLFSKLYYPSREISLEKLSGISMRGTWFKSISLSDGNTTYHFNIRNVGEKEFLFFKNMILKQVFFPLISW